MHPNQSVCYKCQNMRILYKFASRSRPEKFFSAVKTITDNAQTPNYTILATLDDDDSTMSIVQDGDKVTVVRGASKSKIHAINRDIPENWDILVNMSDDMRFLKLGFDAQIISDFAGNLDQILHYPDGHTGDKLISMSIMGRKYYDRFGYIYHPQYKSLWCDNEAMDVAKSLGCYKWIPTQIFEHVHPAWVGGPVDALLLNTQNYYQEDEITYLRRKKAGFPAHNV